VVAKETLPPPLLYLTARSASRRPFPSHSRRCSGSGGTGEGNPSLPPLFPSYLQVYDLDPGCPSERRGSVSPHDTTFFFVSIKNIFFSPAAPSIYEGTGESRSPVLYSLFFFPL